MKDINSMKLTLTLLTALLLTLPVARASDTPKLAPAANCEFPADWFLFGMAERNTPEPDFTTITDIPATLDAGGLSLSAKATRLERCRRFLYLDLQTRHGGAWSGRTAYLLTYLESDTDRSLDVGAGADSRMKIWCNGQVVCDALAAHDSDIERIKHRFALPLKKGRNVLAVKVVSGSQGFMFRIGGARELAEEDATERRIAEDQPLLLIPPRIRPFIEPEFGPENTNLTHGCGGIARTPGGRLWVLFGGEQDGPKAWQLLAASDDDGKSWTTRHIIKEPRTPNGFTRGIREGNIWVDPAGRLWWFFSYSLSYDDGRVGVWAAHCDNPDALNLEWSIPERLYDGMVMAKPVVLQDGTWLLPTSLSHRGYIGLSPPLKPEEYKDPNDRPQNRAFVELDPWRMTNFLVSTDQGKTWQRRGGVRAPKNPCWDEPAVFEKAHGGLVCLIRTRDGRVETTSYDHGFNWSKPVPSAIPHAVARIMTLRLASGRILMVKHGALHGDNPINGVGGPNRTHLTAYLSDDDGVSWRGGLLLEERGCSYPDGVQADDGRIYVVYDQGRGAGQILMAVFTEEDVVAGKPVSDRCRLKVPVKQTAAQLMRK
jgi:hypothetical protein